MLCKRSIPLTRVFYLFGHDTWRIAGLMSTQIDITYKKTFDCYLLNRLYTKTTTLRQFHVTYYLRHMRCHQHCFGLHVTSTMHRFVIALGIPPAPLKSAHQALILAILFHASIQYFQSRYIFLLLVRETHCTKSLLLLIHKYNDAAGTSSSLLLSKIIHGL